MSLHKLHDDTVSVQVDRSRDEKTTLVQCLKGRNGERNVNGEEGKEKVQEIMTSLLVTPMHKYSMTKWARTRERERGRERERERERKRERERDRE